MMAKKRWLPAEAYKEVVRSCNRKNSGRTHTCFHCGEQYGLAGENVIITRDPKTGRTLDVTCTLCKALKLDMLTDLLMFPSLLTHHHPIPYRVSETLPPVRRKYYDPKKDVWIR